MAEAVKVMVRVRPMNRKEFDRGMDALSLRLRECGGSRLQEQSDQPGQGG
jgi:hypothetical protein